MLETAGSALPAAQIVFCVDNYKSIGKKEDCIDYIAQEIA